MLTLGANRQQKPLLCWRTHRADSHTWQLGTLPKSDQSQIFLLILNLNMDSKLPVPSQSDSSCMPLRGCMLDMFSWQISYSGWGGPCISLFCELLSYCSRKMVGIQVANCYLCSCTCSMCKPTSCPSCTSWNYWNGKKSCLLLFIFFPNKNKMLAD